MKWWTRLILSVASIIWGFISLDFLYYAYKLLCDINGGSYSDKLTADNAMQLVGGLMFVLWFMLTAVYIAFVKHLSPHIDIIEKDPKSGKDKIRFKWFDTSLQILLIFTGIVLRWLYLIVIYFPNR